MSYITPDGTIQLFKNIPLAPDNENTLYFATTAAKDSFFDGLQNNDGYSLGSFDNCTYSREQRGFVRIGTQIGSVYNATYMRFKNTSFENKWFYAFVTSVEYISNKTVQINYTLDHMLTYMGDFSLKDCFIERETVANDKVGKNILDEGLEIGSYINEDVFFFNSTNTAKIVVCVADPSDMGSGDGLAGNIYNPAILKSFDTAAAANTYITQLVNANLGDNILGVFMIPTVYNDAVTSTSHAGVSNYAITKPRTNVDGFVPQNNKLFVYPYKRLLVDNNEGAQQEYRYEYFGTDGGTADDVITCSFQEQYSICGTCESYLVPMHYMTGFTQRLNFTARIGKSHFPECAWSIDSYKAYRAQINANLPVDLTTGIIKGAANGALSGATNGGDVPVIGNLFSATMGGVMGAASGAIGPIVDALAVNSFEVERGSQVKGSMSANTMFTLSGCKTYTGYKQCIDGAHAKAIDDFFTMYGYKVSKVGTPNMNIRPYFTYIKTIGCIATGEIPADYLRLIEARFNAGVRFWNNMTYFGNYAVNNQAQVR